MSTLFHVIKSFLLVHGIKFGNQNIDLIEEKLAQKQIILYPVNGWNDPISYLGKQ